MNKIKIVNQQLLEKVLANNTISNISSRHRPMTPQNPQQKLKKMVRKGLSLTSFGKITRKESLIEERVKTDDEFIECEKQRKYCFYTSKKVESLKKSSRREKKAQGDASSICTNINNVFEELDKENQLLTKRRTIKLERYKDKKFERVWKCHHLEWKKRTNM